MVINPIVGVYIPIIRIPVIKGGMTIPNTTSLDPGSYKQQQQQQQLGGLFLVEANIRQGDNSQLQHWTYQQTYETHKATTTKHPSLDTLCGTKNLCKTYIFFGARNQNWVLVSNILLGISPRILGGHDIHDPI